MMRLTPEQREVIGYLVAAADGDTTEEQCARVEALVKDNEEMQSFVVQLLSQEAWLSLHSLHESTRTVEVELTSTIRGLLTAAEANMVSQAVADQFAGESHLPQEAAVADAIAQVRSRERRAALVHQPWIRSMSFHYARNWVVPVIYAALLIGIGVSIGAWFDHGIPFRGVPAVAVDDGPNGAPVEKQVAANCQAHLVQYTSCAWGPEMWPRTSNSLSGGDSLNLIYGLADLDLDWPGGGTAKVRLEGPAGMVLMADGGVNLNHGKLTANVAFDNGRFGVETPLCRVEIDSNAKIGVAVSPKSTEIHVFRGEAKVVTAWASNSEWSDSFDVPTNQAIQLIATEAGTVQVRRVASAPDLFVSQIEMTDDLLDVSQEYVSAVMNSSPVCYWRFDRPADSIVRNEMADQYHGQVFGPVEWVKEHDNWTIQCGGWVTTDMTPAHVVADRALESVGIQSYSLEAWVKPSHFHLGAIAALLNPNTSVPGHHGMLLELGGPWSIFTGREHPGRVRFLHRDPPEESGGNSCFSDVAYSLRRWQHVVAVKTSSEMRLYIDGREVAKHEDSTPRPDGLLLLVGQLDRERNERLFTGQLDELAYYERALSAEEIEKHYRLLQPENPMPRGTTAVTMESAD
jgi:hypothetical protein